MPQLAPQHSSQGRDIHLVGFGSQGRAWAENLRDSGWNVRIYLSRAGDSWSRALEMGFDPMSLTTLSEQILRSESSAPSLVAFLCPDDLIDGIYREYLAAIPRPLLLVLAHGYAVYAGGLKPEHSDHGVALLAPKAIGPKLRAAYVSAHESVRASTAEGEPSVFTIRHSLKAAFHVPASPRHAKEILLELAEAMGFARENLVTAEPSVEAIGDLISEQGLLCGTLFTFLEWTMEAMEDAGVPSGLIREECLTELELVAGLLRERGPSATLGAISAAAQCGTIRMNRRLISSGAREAFQAQVQEVLSKRFVEEFTSGEWREEAQAMAARLKKRESSFAGSAEFRSGQRALPQSSPERNPE